MTALDGLGYFAASLVLATFCAKTMVPLRLLAVSSNIAFMSYGLAAGLWPILMLHVLMLPLNLHRLRGALAMPRSEPSKRSDNGRGKWNSTSGGSEYRSRRRRKRLPRQRTAAASRVDRRPTPANAQ